MKESADCLIVRAGIRAFPYLRLYGLVVTL